jgi:hypothetical protein
MVRLLASATLGLCSACTLLYDTDKLRATETDSPSIYPPERTPADAGVAPSLSADAETSDGVSAPAPSRYCPVPLAVFCDDFDGPEGVDGWDMTIVGGRLSADSEHFASSPRSAMALLTGNGGQATLEKESPVLTSRRRITFRLRVDLAERHTLAIVRQAPVESAIILAAWSGTLRFEIGGRSAPAVPLQMGRWMDVSIEWSRVAPVAATLSIDGAVAATVSASNLPPGPYSVTMGAMGDGAAIARYDDVVFW